MPVTYIVFEVQKFSSEQISIVTPIFTSSNKNAAESEFHRLCSVAAVSTVPRHTVIFMDDMGVMYDEIKSWEHEVQES